MEKKKLRVAAKPSMPKSDKQIQKELKKDARKEFEQLHALNRELQSGPSPLPVTLKQRTSCDLLLLCGEDETALDKGIERELQASVGREPKIQSPLPTYPAHFMHLVILNRETKAEAQVEIDCSRANPRLAGGMLLLAASPSKSEWRFQQIVDQATIEIPPRSKVVIVGVGFAVSSALMGLSMIGGEHDR